MTQQYKVFADEEVLTADDTNNYLMNQSVVQVGTESDLGTLPNTVKIAYVTGDGMTFTRDTSNNWVLVPQGTWITDVATPATYSSDIPATTWTALYLFGPFTVTVPAGRGLEIEWTAPIVSLPSTTGLQARINVAGGTIVDAGYWSNSNAQAIGLPTRLRGVYTGTGASVAFTVEVERAGTGTPTVSCQNVGPAFLRHRIT